MATEFPNESKALKCVISVNKRIMKNIILTIVFLHLLVISNGQDKYKKYSYIVLRKADTISVENITAGKTVDNSIFINHMSMQSVKYFFNNKGEFIFMLNGGADSNGSSPTDSIFLNNYPENNSKKIPFNNVYIERSIFSLQRLFDNVFKNKKVYGTVPFFRLSTRKKDSAIINIKSKNRAEITIGNLVFKLKINSSGLITEGSLPELSIVFKKTRFIGPVSFQNPFESSSPKYTSKEINFVSRNSDTLFGTLNLPVVPKKSAVYIIITGLSQSNRNGGGTPYAPFFQIASALGKNNIASLRLDDRGTYKSSGTWKGTTMYDELSDIEDAVEWLKKQSAIDSHRIGLIGWSEGAVIATMLAAKRKDLKSVILMAAMGTNGKELAYYQISSAIGESDLSQAAKDSVIETEIESAKKESSRMKALINYNTFPNADSINIPVLMLHGSSDKHVSVSQALTFFNRLKRKGNPNDQFKIFGNINHLWLPDNRGQAQFWNSLQSFTIPSEVLWKITSWANIQNTTK